MQEPPPITSRQYSKHSLDVFMCGTTRSSSQQSSSVPGNSHTLKLRWKRLQKPLYLLFVEEMSHFDITGAGTGAVGIQRDRELTPSTGGLCRGRGYGPGYAWIRLRSLSKTLCDLRLLRLVRQAQSPTGRKRPPALHTELQDPVRRSHDEIREEQHRTQH
jgi:hypothetical protein